MSAYFVSGTVLDVKDAKMNKVFFFPCSSCRKRLISRRLLYNVRCSKLKKYAKNHKTTVTQFTGKDRVSQKVIFEMGLHDLMWQTRQETTYKAERTASAGYRHIKG